jgi:Domain of unknown function (DUF1788)
MTNRSSANNVIDRVVSALKTDLMAEGGAKISTMRNYQFAIAVYPPDREFEMRRKLKQMQDELQAVGWNVLSISLLQLFIERLKSKSLPSLERLIAMEKRLADKTSDRGLNYLKEKLTPEVEGADGIAQDIIRKINEFMPNATPDKKLILLSRAGGLYPFFRSSGLLRHLDGKTCNLPIVLLYPGDRQDVSSLSFMGEQTTDRDYRPRIYS